MLRSFCGVLVAFVLALALAQDAGAKPRPFVIPGGQTSSFELRGSNGYRIEVSSEGREAEVFASRGSGAAFVTYSVASHRHGRRGFEAKLPGIGRIAVEFRPAGKARKIPPLPGCTSKPALLERGTFVGTINFHGERGYTEVVATRAKGDVFRTYRETCSTGNGGSDDEKSFNDLKLGASLTVATRSGGVFFTAGRIEGGGATVNTYMAAQISNSRGMRIMRAVDTDIPRDSFSAEYTGATASARVEPGRPFSGAADFGASPDGTVSWTGDLSVTFPGTGPVPLTGKRFVAQLCVRNKCADNASSSAAPTPRPWPR